MMLIARCQRPIRWIPAALFLWCGTALFAQPSLGPPTLSEGRPKVSLPGQRIASWPADPWMSVEEERRIFSALRQPWQGPEFVETPLVDAIRTLEQSAGIALDIDERALDEVGLTSHVPVTFAGERISRGMALRKMLRDSDLVLQIAGGMVTITTPEAAEASPVTRVYDVTPLVAAPGQPVSRQSIEGSSLAELIQRIVIPDTWEALGGPSTMEGRRIGGRAVLVVATTSEAHFQIIPLLNRLNAVAYATGSLDGLPRSAGTAVRRDREPTLERIRRSDSRLPRFGQ